MIKEISKVQVLVEAVLSFCTMTMKIGLLQAHMTGICMEARQVKPVVETTMRVKGKLTAYNNFRFKKIRITLNKINK